MGIFSTIEKIPIILICAIQKEFRKSTIVEYSRMVKPDVPFVWNNLLTPFISVTIMLYQNDVLRKFRKYVSKNKNRVFL